jgi:mono/diheme cytochrome c family protein
LRQPTRWEWTALLAAAAFGCALVAMMLSPRPSFADDPESELTGGLDPADPELITAGRALYTVHCDNEFCHGPRGGGNFMGTPNAQKLMDKVWFYGDGSYAGVIKVIVEGIPASPMEPWGTKLGMDKVRAVAAFVLSLSADK